MKKYPLFTILILVLFCIEIAQSQNYVYHDGQSGLNYLPLFNGITPPTLGNSLMYQTGNEIVLGTDISSFVNQLDVRGLLTTNGVIDLRNSESFIRWHTNGQSSGSNMLRFQYYHDQSGLFLNVFSISQLGVSIGPGDPDARIDIKESTPGSKLLLIGNDSYFTDINEDNTVALYGNQDNSYSHLLLGENGVFLNAHNGNLGIGHGKFVPIADIELRGEVYIEQKLGIGTQNPITDLQVDGTVLIGDATILPAGFMLYVNDGILAERVKVELVSNWSDFVFEDDYKLMSIPELELYIERNKHLPDIPSTQEVSSEGIDLAEMDAKLLQKIEELTLYLIEQQKEIEALKQEVKRLQK